MADLKRICVPVANIYDAQGGSLQRQALFGDGFIVEQIMDGWAQGQTKRDGYVGVVAQNDLANWADTNSRVRDLGAHIYTRPDIKTVPNLHIPYQSSVTVVDEKDEFVEIAGGGFIHQMQLQPVTVYEADYIITAERYLGVPYLWGGNSQYGIDCSGLVSAALRGGGIPCAGDSGDQARHLGVALGQTDALQRGDFIFWKGHVGLMVSEQVMLHANGYHMKVVREPLAQAVERIQATGGGDITIRRRLAV